jgi:hypothetical protein
MCVYMYVYTLAVLPLDGRNCQSFLKCRAGSRRVFAMIGEFWYCAEREYTGYFPPDVPVIFLYTLDPHRWLKPWEWPNVCL